MYYKCIILIILWFKINSDCKIMKYFSIDLLLINKIYIKFFKIIFFINKIKVGIN